MNNGATDIVIGSGPSALATVEGILEKGRKVTVVDAGEKLEANRAALRDALGATKPDGWDDDTLAELRSRQHDITDSVARFGSRFALRSRDDVVFPANPNVVLQSSRAFGGLSNVWGAAVLPWAPGDLAGWPIAPADLQPHYTAIGSIVSIAGSAASFDDILATGDLPLARRLPATRQAEALLRRLKPTTTQGGAQFWPGPARQAAGPDCLACGLCLYGCPYGQIFNSSEKMAAHLREGRIEYQQAEVVRIRESGEGVTLDIADGRPPITGARVFVATGVLETARLMFESDRELAERGMVLRDSRHFFTPHLTTWGAGNISAAPHHTLALAFVELRDQAISPWTVHSQLYGWNNFYAREMFEKYGRNLGLLQPLFERVARRLIVVQSFLHSDHCAKIHLQPARGDPQHRLSAEVVEADGFEDRVGRVRRAMARYLRRAGLIAITRAGQIGLPGSSFHIGATLPMTKSPRRGNTDALGRPHGAIRIHVVDASVMPAIPASTITLSVMANAHRIATTA
ncbi:GMC family oxidoreductase [Ruegeria sediminis]|uniref:GMC family oxidoreductase n=1 Tax=Ruegeria sediminis TaxID=2583820 RepID=A0ABY2X0F1_9RHOB|nr:GMC oxidoreductase [Ruegeria sediminis]TMV08442.1 GMC family oxidoreductase [Ruegeria sediminis]